MYSLKMALYFSTLIIISCFLKIHCATDQQSSPVTPIDRLAQFYESLKNNPNIKYCPDKTKLLPDCKECIPGLQQKHQVDKSSPCSEFTKESADIRNEIADLTRQRYGAMTLPDRPFGLYPYLEMPDFIVRQERFGSMLVDRKAEHVMDIGSYYNPIHLFFNDNNYCPKSIVIIEPILDAMSAIVSCKGNSLGSTHIIILPITFRYYMEINRLLPSPDHVVCIGCDSHYGPNRRMLETAFKRPYTLLIEYPSEYVHNAPFKKMMGTGAGEKLAFHYKFQPNTNATKYTKRVMKVIEYV